VSEPPNTTLRPAQPDDAPQAAPLIYAAGPALFSAVFGPPERAILRFFTALFRLPRNPFSYENGIVAEQGGRIVGLALAADAAERRRIGRRLFWLAPRLRGPFALLRQFPNAWDIMACTSVPPSASFYLSILAVAPESRRQGIGSLLLAEVRRRAEAAGSPVLALHTEIDNHTAQRLYQRHGYIETYRKAAKKADRTGVQGFVMMELPLTPSPPDEGANRVQ
jgi:ribosomal protein S18 acetylase RimI-like enzyme